MYVPFTVSYMGVCSLLCCTTICALYCVPHGCVPFLCHTTMCALFVPHNDVCPLLCPTMVCDTYCALHGCVPFAVSYMGVCPSLCPTWVCALYCRFHVIHNWLLFLKVAMIMASGCRVPALLGEFLHHISNRLR